MEGDVFAPFNTTGSNEFGGYDINVFQGLCEQIFTDIPLLTAYVDYSNRNKCQSV